MRKTYLLSAFMVFSLSSGLAGFELKTLEVRLGLGPTYWHGGEFNRALRGGNDYNRDELEGVEGSYKPLGLGFNLSAEAIYWFNPRMAAGLNVGYAGSSVNKYPVSMDYGNVETNLAYGASALAVRPSFHYGFPLCPSSFLDFFLGPSFYCGCFHFEKNIDIESDHYESTFEFKGKASALGFHAGVGVDYKLSEKFRLYASMNVEAVSLKNLKDEWTSEVTTADGTYTQRGKGTLWVYDYQPDGTAYPLLGYGSNPPSDPGVSNARKGSIGGPSFSFALGIKYKFKL